MHHLLRARPARASRRTRLAIALGFALAAAPVSSIAATLEVGNCNDSGPGSLREALATAPPSSMVDLSALACGTITLTSGELAVDTDMIAIQGPGAASLTIDAGGTSRVFEHSGSGEILLSGLTIRGGSGNGLGGCIHSASSVTLADSVMEDCRLDGAEVWGAAIAAARDVTLISSTIRDMQAHAVSSGQLEPTVRGGAVFAYTTAMFDSTISGVDVSSSSNDNAAGAYGGGIYAFAGLTMTRSRIENVSVAVSGTYVFAFGGGAESIGTVALVDSTISGNKIDVSGALNESIANGGGLRIAPFGGNYVSVLRSTISGNAILCNGACPYPYLFGGGIATYVPLTLSNATVSGNRTRSAGGGIFVAQDGTTSISNSTITNNSAAEAAAIYGNDSVFAIESSIVAGNAGTSGSALDIVTGGGITGTHNLIASANVPLPPDTISADPVLGPLVDNGGFTPTHALLTGSPAIDAGDDVLNLDSDQRGGSFVRVFGAAADIGAFESQPDILFSNGFDG